MFLIANATNNLITPLNNYSFFESFQSEIASNGNVSIDIDLESDYHSIFRPAGAAEGRYVISRFVLWVPRMIFNYKGENLFLEKYLKTHTWPYLKERIEIAVTWQQNVTFKITSSVMKTKTRFRTISMAQLQLIDGIYYPQERFS